MKRMKGWRTIAKETLLVIVAVSAMPEVSAIIPPGWLPYIMLAGALAGMILRKFTTSPMGKKE